MHIELVFQTSKGREWSPFCDTGIQDVVDAFRTSNLSAASNGYYQTMNFVNKKSVQFSKELPYNEDTK